MKFVPHDYQTKAIQRIEDQTHCGLFLEMGLGKTVITLTAIQDLINDFAVSKVLVIAPKRVAEDTWSREHQKWDHLQDGGHVIVWYGLTWSLELYQQANARLHRQGQKMPVIIHHLIAEGTVDEQVMKALKAKDTSQTALMRALKERMK